MYHVKVYRMDGRYMDGMSIPFGQWSEIGYWLDNNGYIDSSFKVTVVFQDR